MRRLSAVLAAVVILAAWGCVIRTEHKIDAHVQLDIRHVQEQAEEVLDYIEGDRDTLPELESKEPKEKATSFLNGVWNAIDPMPAAHAQEDLNTSSPRVRQIMESLRQRHDKVQQYKDKGCFGENNRGYIELRDCSETETAEKKNELQQLLAKENEDRKALYNEIARLNKEQDISISTVESVFALQRLKRAKSGEEVQLPDAGDRFEDFKQTSLCKKLGDACKPGAWVTVP